MGFTFIGDIIHRGYVAPRELCGHCAVNEDICNRWLTNLAIEDGSEWRPSVKNEPAVGISDTFAFQLTHIR